MAGPMVLRNLDTPALFAAAGQVLRDRLGVEALPFREFPLSQDLRQAGLAGIGRALKLRVLGGDPLVRLNMNGIQVLPYAVVALFGGDLRDLPEGLALFKL